MTRPPSGLSVVDEMVHYYESDKPGHKIWFSRKIKQLSQEDHDKVWEELERRGHSKPLQKPTPRQVVRWTDEEWDRLTDLVEDLRIKSPANCLTELVNQVLPQFPENRRRVVKQVKHIKPIVDRLIKRGERLLTIKNRPEETHSPLSEQKSSISREEVLGTLTDEEVLTLYGERLLDLLPADRVLDQFPSEVLLSHVGLVDIVSFLVNSVITKYFDGQQALLKALQNLAPVAPKPDVKQNGIAPKPIVKPPLPRIAIVGLLPAQQNVVGSELKGRATFHFVDKNRRDGDAIPTNQDYVVLMANFISHCLQDQAKKKAEGTPTKLVVHHGGIDTLIGKLDQLL